MRDAGVNLLFLSGNTRLLGDADAAESRRPAQPDHVPRRPVRRRQRLRRRPRTRPRPVSRTRPRRRAADGRPEHRAGQRRRRLDHHQAGALDVRGHRRESGRPHSRSDRLGVPRTSRAEIPGLEVVAGGTAWQGGDNPQQWTATIYPGPKGNFVFNAATIFWAQGLSDPPGHTLPWSHWSRPHGPDARVQTHHAQPAAARDWEVTRTRRCHRRAWVSVNAAAS